MKRIVIAILFITIALHANTKQKMFDLYQQGHYLLACNLGLNGFSQYKNDEGYVSLYAFSCLKADLVDRLSAPIMALHQSKEARTNAAYFSVIVMQKKLLMQSLYDNQPIIHLKLPTSSHLLSKVFDLYVGNPQPNQSIKEYVDLSDKRLIYKLYTAEVNGKKTIAIDEYYDKILTKHHVY